MPADPDTLYAEAACYICTGVTQAEALMLALYRRWLLTLNPNADTTPDALLQYGSCYSCNSNGSIFDVMEIAMLEQISTV